MATRSQSSSHRPMRASDFAFAPTAALLLGALPLVAGHGDEAGDMHDEPAKVATPTDDTPMSYFRYGHYGGWMLAHSGLMILAWVVSMPLAIMLSTARSRYHLPAQVVFHILNGLGVFAGIVYNRSTPDLYKGNSHHPLGWVLTAFTIAWTVMSMFTAYGDYKSKQSSMAHSGITNRSLAQYEQVHQYSDQPSPTRWSRDSGMGSSRQNSSDSIFQKPQQPQSPLEDPEHFEEDDGEDSEKHGFLGNNKVDRFMSRHMPRLSSTRAAGIVRFSQIFLEKILMLLGFATLASGFLVYGGLSRDRQIFSILAHFIKGGIFFWYGLLTLGRWMGAFTEFGWAWNVRPTTPSVARWKTRVPSAEFVESFVIWLYGASNIFLEHLNKWGKEWSASDLEHLSLTVLFFGGGLLGMMIESAWIREMFSTNVAVQEEEDEERAGASRNQLYTQPKSERFSMNPMPGLVVMVLGAAMSAHHQKSMVSTMMHAQWGTLFFVFGCARAATYVLVYLQPPTSHFTSRPPSELVSSFCLTAGGLLFMISARDTVDTIESNDLNAMAIFTVVMGLTGILLSWEFVCFAIKGWAVRKEKAAAGKPIS
ncbi:hypothetical protein KC349_g5046 [Hortaea werneckii]|nr:hypothetical protein KC349_g5046 [Hortaea werneckii]